MTSDGKISHCLWKGELIIRVLFFLVPPHKILWEIFQFDTTLCDKVC